MLNVAKISNPFDNFFANIWVMVRRIPTNKTKYNIENTPVLDVIIKNQNDSPAVTARDLNLGEDTCMLYRINECH